MATTYNKVTFNAATLLSLENDTITAADLRTGVTAHDATGQAIAGTLVPGIIPNVYQDSEGFVVLDDEGGGSPVGGLAFETGTYNPADLAVPHTVALHSTHSKPPIYVAFVQAGSKTSTGDRVAQLYFYTGDMGGVPQTDTGSPLYGYVLTIYANNSLWASGFWRVTQSLSDTWDGTATSHPRYWATESTITLYGSSSRNLAEGPYNWFAVWR